MINPLEEIARLLARAYIRLLVAETEKARNSAVSLSQSAPNPLDVPRPEWPPVVRENARRARP